MDWLKSLDVAGFRLINQTWSNSLFDWALPFFSWNSFFVPALAVLTIGLLWKGGPRGRLFLLFLLVVTVIGDPVICKTLKRVIARPRPFEAFPDAHVLVGRVASASMPSGHSANWFAATMVAFLFYRRSLWFMLPLAVTVAFSRIYLGVHYPSDVLAGAFIGVGYAAGLAWALNTTWQTAGQRWFPLWWSKLPSLLHPPTKIEAATELSQRTAFAVTEPPLTRPSDTLSPPRGEGWGEGSIQRLKGATRDNRSGSSNPEADENQHWLRLGYVFILALFVGRLGYLASGTIQLSEDEAYQWLWSKHPALSYYSKPPLIAYTQFMGTALWGDREFGVRFFSPVIGAVLSFLLLRFLAKEINPRAGVWLLLVITATPLMAAGTILMTIDPLSVLFWTAAMISGWNAVQRDSTRSWLWTGLWTGLGFLSKYTALFQLLCWAVFFILWPQARRQIRRPGPYLALLITAVCTVPVLIWNSQNGWITVRHLANRGGLDQTWSPTLRFFWDFLAAESALLNPVFLAFIVWTSVAFWWQRQRNGLTIYLFSMGAPLFLFYFFYTLRARVQPNWIVPSVLPLFCLLVVYWEKRWREGVRFIKPWLILGVGSGIVAVALLHNTDLIRKITGYAMPAEQDPLRRVRAWRELALAVGEARSELLREGKPVFIIGDHYGITGLISFYLPEGKAGVPNDPLIYYQSSTHPENQFYFWPGYRQRHGQNAIYVRQNETPLPPPERITKEFASVTDLGMREIPYRGQVFHRVQLFACRDLRKP